jgi:glycine/D-amino acid oxidase-like deaminating enzyme
MIPSTAIVVGAGIVGLALAKALAERGCRVVVFERHERAVGASLRSPGALWLLGEANGRLLELARRSRRAWQEFCEAAPAAAEDVGKSAITSSPMVFTTRPPAASVARRMSAIMPLMVCSATASPAVS